MKKLSSDDKCYMAGFLDGEGTFTLEIVPNKSNTVTLRPRVLGCNTNKEVIEWLKEATGIGKVYYTDGSPPRNSGYYFWTVYKREEIRDFLKEILPYLKVKKRQAELLYEFACYPIERPHKGYPERLLRIAEIMRALNKKGKTARHL
jgi:hypothetical protein